MTDPMQVLAKLERIRGETLLRLEGLDQRQLDCRPPVEEDEDDEEWSLGEVFMHLAIDEIYLRELLARPLLEGVSPPADVTFLPPPPPRTTPKAVISFWFRRARAETRRLLTDWAHDADLDLAHDGGFGALTAMQWIEGYGGHEAFHHQQIDRLLEQTARLGDDV
jgi:hypothetical protein